MESSVASDQAAMCTNEKLKKSGMVNNKKWQKLDPSCIIQQAYIWDTRLSQSNMILKFASQTISVNSVL